MGPDFGRGPFVNGSPRPIGDRQARTVREGSVRAHGVVADLELIGDLRARAMRNSMTRSRDGGMGRPRFRSR